MNNPIKSAAATPHPKSKKPRRLAAVPGSAGRLIFVYIISSVLNNIVADGDKLYLFIVSTGNVQIVALYLFVWGVQTAWVRRRQNDLAQPTP